MVQTFLVVYMTEHKITVNICRAYAFDKIIFFHNTHSVQLLWT